jgi:hypothetical protein
MDNLCDNCKFAKWDLESVANANCDQKPVFKVITENNCVKECSSYQTRNIIRCIINWVKHE